MGLLFKTTLVHIKKNSFVVFVLSFFVASGVTVLASSDLLQANLNKGFQEINFDGNPHDLVLLSKSFKADQNLQVDPIYESNFKSLKFTPSWGYRWSFDNLKSDFFIKNEDFKKIPENKDKVDDASGGGEKGSASGAERIRPISHFFHIPRGSGTDYSHHNSYLSCISGVSFFSSVSSGVSFMDYHKAGFTKVGAIPEDDRENPEIFKSVCPDGTTKVFRGSAGIKNVFNSIGGYYAENIARESKDASSSKAKDEFTLSEDELHEFHRRNLSFNPAIIWHTKNVQGVYYFMKMWENDHFFSFHVPFKLLLNGTNLASKFRKLILDMVNPKIYFGLDDSTKQQINYFNKSNLFNKVHVRYWISGLLKQLESISSWAPMIPGLTYPETMTILIKMFLWDYLNENSNRKVDDVMSQEWSDDKLLEAKARWKKMIQEWDVNNVKGLESWNPFPKFIENGKTYDTKEPLQDENRKGKKGIYDKSENFIFSTVRPKATVAEAKNFPLEDYEEWSENVTTDSLSGYKTPYSSSDNKKIIEVFKDTIEKWIDGEYYQGNKNSTTQKTIIPGFSLRSKANTQANSIEKKFSNSTVDRYRNFPDSFDEMYMKLYKFVRGTLHSYVLTLAVSNLKIVKSFIAESELFTLSFLLRNFTYDASKATDLNRRRRNKSQSSGGASLDNDISITIPKLVSEQYPPRETDYSPLINYHKSIVVTNTGSTTHKQNVSPDDGANLWHSFKIIAQDRKDNSYVNRIKILEGNPLFDAKLDIMTALQKLQFHNYEYRDFFKTLRRMKYKNPKYAEMVTGNVNHLLNENDAKWSEEDWVTFEDSIFGQFLGVFRRGGNDISKQGARVMAMVSVRDVIRFTRIFNVISHITPPPTPGYLDQFSAYFAVVSPFYAESNNIRPISNEKYDEFKKIVESDTSTQEEWEKQYSEFVLNPSNHDSIINVNGNKLIVVGIGMSPDMLLPSQSYLNLVPNKSKEALVFVDKYGYDQIKHNSLSSWDEYYLSIAYPQAIKAQHLEDDYQRQISDYIQDFVNEEIRDDGTSNSFELKTVKGAPMNQLVYLRSQYVDRFMFSVSALFNLILTFMGLIVFFTVWVLIKRYTTASLNTFGVFVANGISRGRIIFNSSVFILVPAVMGVVIGYLSALALQPMIFNFLSKVWYLTPVFSGFSISYLFHYILLSCGILGPISWLCSYFMLKDDVNRLMKMNVVFKQNKLTQLVYKYLSNLSSLWKFRLSVIMNTAGRGLILSSSTVFLFVFTSFLFNNFGQFQAVSDSEMGTKKYGFSISFETPTLQSGQPNLISYSNFGDTFLDGTTHSKDVMIQTSKGQWEKQTINFNHERPEVIGTGIKNTFYVSDIRDYFAQCKSLLKIDDWYNRMGVMDLDYIGNVLEQNPYNLYLFGQTATKKTDKNIDCNKPISESYTTQKLEFVEQNNAFSAVFGKSQKEVGAKEEPKFNPSVDAENKIEYLSDYVPVKNELRKSSTTASSNPGASSPTPYEMVKYGSEPLFKPLIEYYKNKAPLLSKNATSEDEYKSYGLTNIPDTNSQKQGTSSTAKLSGDFVSFDDKHKHPTLSRLFRDNANYWLFTYIDLTSIVYNPTFLKNKVLLPILFNHNWTFSLFGTTITFNPWNEFSEFFSKYSTELISSLDTNYANFVEAIIKSRYGAYFVNRFMNKHTLSAGQNLADVSHTQGKKYWQKPTWKITKDMLQENNKQEIDEGLYWINPDKLIYFHEKLQGLDAESTPKTKVTQKAMMANKHPERFVIFRPDFLYLIYAILKDPHFQKDDIAPIKIGFHNNVYVPEYSNKYEEFSVIGDYVKDANQNKGLTATNPNMQYEDYAKEPNGDQTYTYLNAQIPGLDSEINVLGIKQDKRGSYVKLYKDGKIINDLLYQSKFDDGSYPLIINHYTARKLNLGVGSTISAKVFNLVDRFNRKARKEAVFKNVNLKVVDIYDSYYKPSFFISQRYANEILGLNLEYGYNGIHTKNFNATKDPNHTTTSSVIGNLPVQLTKAISGYSPSGIYAKQKISKHDNLFIAFLNTVSQNVATSASATDNPFIPPTNHELIKSWIGAEHNTSISNSSDLANLMDEIYGNSYSLLSSIVGLENAGLFNDFVFSTVSDLIISIINLFITIFTPLLVFALLVITNLIIEDLKNLLTILNLLGFTYSENSVTILLYLGIVLGFSMILSLPIASSLLSLYVNGIFTTLSIYLPIYLRFDYVMVSFAILLSMFGFSYYVSRRKIKSLYLPVAMKSLNE